MILVTLFGVLAVPSGGTYSFRIYTMFIVKDRLFSTENHNSADVVNLNILLLAEMLKVFGGH